jgi:agmatine deiminase
VLVQEKKKHDENFKLLHENKERFNDLRLKDGSKIEVVYLPMPLPVIFKGQRLPVSYANFYFSNAAVLVPTFNDLNGRIALVILSELNKDRPVIGIHALDLLWGLGTIHCLTQEQSFIKPKL